MNTEKLSHAMKRLTISANETNEAYQRLAVTYHDAMNAYVSRRVLTAMGYPSLAAFF